MTVWQSLPITVNKTTDLAQLLGMMPNKAGCTLKGTGGFEGGGSIPVALMDEEIMNAIRNRTGAFS